MKITIINKITGQNYCILIDQLWCHIWRDKKKFLRKNSETTCAGPMLIFIPTIYRQAHPLIFFLNIEIDEYNSHGEIFTWIDKNYISPLNSEDTILIFIIKISLFLIGQTENNVESMVNNWWSYTVLQLPWLLFFLFSMVILTSIFVYF